MSERTELLESISADSGKGYAYILGRMCGYEYRTQDEKARGSRRLINARLDGFQQSAVLVLLADEYNGIETEKQAEELLKFHSKLYREASEKDEAEKERNK
ncbi:hypothetical protein [Streptomyces sp. NPDC057363]|uniref:hypothetical protein n=1 Tax=Streptomyces sp. NPDC057363 TaxID=3346107 RepID=UPI003637BC9B